MKALLLSLFITFVATGPSSLLATDKPDCPDNSCFDTKIIEEQKQDDCTTYTLEISQDGSCRYALSHFSIEVPCGSITDVHNSEGWAMEVGTTDPTTGITGIKIDDIKDFGEKSISQSFTVTYTVCGRACESLAPEKVAYKASTCVHYDEVESPYTPMVASMSAQNLRCAGSADGSVDLTVSGGAGPFTFVWSNGATTEDIQNLSAGAYQVNISDSRGETLTQEVEITAPNALQLDAEIIAASCAGNGSISVKTEGGTAPYTYSWSSGETTTSIKGPAGRYELILTDAQGCSLVESFIIEESSALQVSISGGSNCENNVLEGLISGGTAPYTYAWSSGESTATMEVQSSGTYTLKVTDANGCSTSASKEVIIGEAPVLTLDSTHPGCANGSDGSIDLTVEGVSGEYSVRWNNGATTEDLQNLPAGTYTVTVTGADGCSSSATAVLSNPQAIFVRNTGIVHPDCHGGLGSITVDAYLGVEPYTFEWNNGATGNTINDLEPGAYEVTVTDANGCTAIRSFVINAPRTPHVTISGGDCSSTLTARASGGTAPYSYEWTGGESTSSIEITEEGFYEVVVTDANGCSATASIQAQDPSNAISLEYEVQNPTCHGDTNGSINLTASGGTGELTYSWSNGVTTEDLENLPAGTYTVTVSNSSGCTSSASINVSAPYAIFIRSVEVKNVSCQGEAGSIQVEAYFGTAPYTYSWSNGAKGAFAENLESGYHTVEVTDANGCSNTREFYISKDSAPQVRISGNGCGAHQELTAVVSGGKAPYTYSWSSGETTAAISATTGVYNVTVTDANGCNSSANLTLEEAESPISLAVSVNEVSCAGASNGSASIQVNGGVAPFTFDWSTGSKGSEIKDLKAGVYSVKVTDAGGCSEMLAFTVAEPQAISITAVAENNGGCGGVPTGSVEVQVKGGTAPYLYNWNTGNETSSLSGLTAGVYTLTVEDAKGCVAIRSFKIENTGGGSGILASMEACADTVVCRGSTARLPITFTGEGPYTFVYTDGNQQYSITTSANPYMLEVQPQSLSTYRLLSVKNSCGAGNVSGQVNIQVSDCTKGKICEDPCFDTKVVKRETSGSCETITLQVSTEGACRYALSHFTVGVGCGSISQASNSAGWPMELNSIDPTTGLYGIKVDEIRNFGEGKNPQSFTLTYTICSEESSCQESLSCGPLVAYKAGSCVYYDKAIEGAFLASSPVANQSSTLLGEIVLLPDFDLYPNPLERGQVLNLKVKQLSEAGSAKLTIRSLTGLQVYEGTYAVSPANNQIILSLPYMPSGTFVVSLEVQGYILTKQLYVL